MTAARPDRRGPDVPALLDALSERGVRFVLVGSVAALAHGVTLQPGDLDITPALDRENLRRLVSLLADLDARPENLGHWETRDDGERRWVVEDDSPEALAGWRADADDVSSLDHLFLTRHGNLDVVPEIAWNYDELAPRAVRLPLHGREPLVAHVDDLLSRMTVARRSKDVERVRRLREIQRGGRP